MIGKRRQMVVSMPALLRAKSNPSGKNLLRIHGVAVGIALLFAGIFFWLNSQQYLTFNVLAPDADRFYQAIWNTLHGGKFLYTSISEASILGHHFSPYMALLSPLLWLWRDIRMLYAVQIAGIAITGLILYHIVYQKHPRQALWFLLAFYLNPALHQVALFEFRRVTLAMPFLALAASGLISGKRRRLLIGLFLALLCKENIGLIVAGVGLYYLIVKHDFKWGFGLLVFGVAWFAGMLLWVIPTLGDGSYQQTSYFAQWGNDLTTILWQMLRQPGLVAQTIFEQSRLAALGRVFLPLGILLPWLGADLLLVIMPLLALTLLASEASMHTLGRWYMAPLLPFFFAAIALALGRLPRRFAPWATALLLGTTLIGYNLYSPAPGGSQFASHRYTQTAHQQKVWQLLNSIPDEANVAAQVAFTTQLAHRETIYMFPRIRSDWENIDTFILGEGFNPYPMPAKDLSWEILNLTSNPDYVVAAEVNGTFLIQQHGEQWPGIPINKAAENSILLDRIELAATDENGFFQFLSPASLAIQPKQQLRVSLYWEALAKPLGERTVSVRLMGADGQLIAQHDGLPVAGSKPTSWWQPGWKLRDVHYLTIPAGISINAGTLELLLYDSYTQERIPFANGEEILRLAVFR